MEQKFTSYTKEDHQIWNILFNRQISNLEGRVCNRYLECLLEMKEAIGGNLIPRFTELNDTLLVKTGWSIQIVPGLIPVEEFFEFLAKKSFCSSRWLRGKHQLDYIEEPDMFHDIFGHVPLLMDDDYAAFARKIGELGLKHIGNPEIIKQLQRIYWFTIEFGILREDENIRIYGAGIISSPKESEYVFDKRVNRKPFNLKEIIHHEFRTDVLQDCYYYIDSFEQLYQSINEFENLIPEKLKRKRLSNC